MRKLLVVTLIGALLCAVVPTTALAGDRHSGGNVAAGVILGATAAVVGGAILGALAAPPAPPVVYAPAPPVVYYTTPPPVVYAAPPVVYTPAPVVVYRHPAPRGYWARPYYTHRGWGH